MVATMSTTQLNAPRRVADVAEYMLERRGPLTAWKLQKLCYYAQAWSLVWDDQPLFREQIEAWANGPVAPALFNRHKGRFYVQTVGGDSSALSPDQRETIDVVLDQYGDIPAAMLIALTHRERPWESTRRRARLSSKQRGNAVIPLDLMAEYYGGLYGGAEEQAYESP